MSDLGFRDLAELIGERFDAVDVSCPQCGPDRRTLSNRRRKVLRVWRDEPGFLRFHCARCGASGYARPDGTCDIDPERLARLKADAAERQRQEEARRARKALEIWNEARPGDGTIVESHLASRALDPAFASLFRFHPRCPHPDGTRLPTMIALVEHAERGAVAIHRTYLQADGTGKARIDTDRASLGPIGGGAVRLAPLVPSKWLVVGEGLETTLSTMQVCHHPGWAALSALGVEALILPPEAINIIIAVDHDESGRGQRAARKAAERFLREGRRVRLAVPPRGMDFNDVLRGNKTQADEADHERRGGAYDHRTGRGAEAREHQASQP